MERLAPTQHGRQGLQRDADHVVVRLLRGQRLPRGLGVEPQFMRAGVRGAEGVAHFLGPDAAGRAEFADLLEEVVVHIEKEAQPGRELVHVQPRSWAWRTYSKPSASVNASSCTALEPASRMW